MTAPAPAAAPTTHRHEWDDIPHPHPELEPRPTIDPNQPWFALHCQAEGCPAIATLHPNGDEGEIYEVLREPPTRPEPIPLHRNPDILAAINEEPDQAELLNEGEPT